MDALMAALLAAALAEAGGRAPWLAAILIDRTRRPGAVFTGAALGVTLVMTLAAIAGGAIAPRMSPDAKQLMLGLALLLAGLAAFARPRPERMERWTAPIVVTAFVGVAVQAVSDAAAFVVFALAARSPLPLAAAVGGVIGTLAVVAPLGLAGEDARRRLPLTAVRLAGGVLFVALGSITGLGALHLI